MQSHGSHYRLGFIAGVLTLLSLASAVPASADCGLASNTAFFSPSQARDVGGAVVTSAFFGTPTARTGTRTRPVYRVSVGDLIAGVQVSSHSIRYHSSYSCGWFDLNLGQTYLFVIGPGRATGDGAIVIETFDPAWRSVTMAYPTLDGRPLPVEPDALIARLREKLPGLPPTDASPPAPPQPRELVLLAIAGLMGAAAWFSRRRRLT